MKQIKALAGTVSFLTLISIGYYGSLKSVERMYGISIGLIAGSILAQTMNNDTPNRSPILNFQGANNLKRRRKILRNLRTRTLKN